jgi:hypothetical protein
MSHQNSRSVADPDKVIWVKPESLRFKLTGTREFQMGLLGIVPGDWDHQREEIEQTAKYRSIVQHIVEGVDWEDTELFALYAARLERGETVRGYTTLGEVKRSYEERITTLLDSLTANGFQLSKTRLRALPYLYIGRDGEILMGRQGNHRYALARILKSEAMPCVVRVRHPEWQRVRERISASSLQDLESLPKYISSHPDLGDVIEARRRELSRTGATGLWQTLQRVFARPA